jgi:Ala-tRNA(Pro) deacylase
VSVLSKIKRFFDRAGVSYELLVHAPVYTSADAAEIRDTDVSMGAKALVFFADKKPILIVVPGNERVNTKKFKRTFGIKDLRMATKGEVQALTTLEVGSIPPVGKSMGVQSYFDQSFKFKDRVVFNAGSHTTSIIMATHDLIKVEEPVIGNFI